MCQELLNVGEKPQQSHIVLLLGENTANLANADRLKKKAAKGVITIVMTKTNSMT